MTTLQLDLTGSINTKAQHAADLYMIQVRRPDGHAVGLAEALAALQALCVQVAAQERAQAATA